MYFRRKKGLMSLMRTIDRIDININKCKSNETKGKEGEDDVDSRLNPLIFGKVEHRQINNLILTDENHKTHQIDHIEIKQNGIFCIETKKYSGWVFGNEFQEQWTQTFKTGKKYQFKNPLKQNKSHIYYIKRVLGNKYKINSLCFT